MPSLKSRGRCFASSSTQKDGTLAPGGGRTRSLEITLKPHGDRKSLTLYPIELQGHITAFTCSIYQLLH
jgi:hypothetical protein